MKRHLLFAAAAAIGLLAMPGEPAHADLPVIDATSIADLLKQIGIQGEQLTQLVNVYNETIQVYGMATNIWGAVEKLVGADQWAGALQTSTNRNPLPFPAADHPGWVGGFNDPSGLPFGAEYVKQNTVGSDPSVYQDGSFTGKELLKSIRSLSSMQAVASNHLVQIETRINALGELFGHLASIGKLQETDSLSARFHSELNYATTQQVQAQQVLVAAQMQRDVAENNQRQWMWQDEKTGIEAACATAHKAASYVSIPACK
jgi:hypothetical protein